MKETPDLYDSIAVVDGIELEVDSMERRGHDNILAMLWEEQPMTWHTIRPFAEQALHESQGKVDFLDVGCGSGVFSLLTAKHLGANALGVDISPRAIEFSNRNAERNGINKAIFRLERYSLSTVPPRSTKVIGLYPPYHLYPPTIEEKITLHAQGGWNGQGLFQEQLGLAVRHVADGGIIFAQQMLIGESVEECLLEALKSTETDRYFYCIFTQILPPFSSKEFLKGVYGERHPDFQNNFSKKYPCLFLVVVIMKAIAEGKTTFNEFEHNFDLHGRSWKDRVMAHKEVAEHEIS